MMMMMAARAPALVCFHAVCLAWAQLKGMRLEECGDDPSLGTGLGQSRLQLVLLLEQAWEHAHQAWGDAALVMTTAMVTIAAMAMAMAIAMMTMKMTAQLEALELGKRSGSALLAAMTMTMRMMMTKRTFLLGKLDLQTGLKQLCGIEGAVHPI